MQHLNCSGSPWQGPEPPLVPSEPPLAAWPPHRRPLTCAAPWQLLASSWRVFSTSKRRERMPRRLRTCWCRPSRRWLQRWRRPGCFDGSRWASFVAYLFGGLCWVGIKVWYGVPPSAAASSSTIVAPRRQRANIAMSHRRQPQIAEKLVPQRSWYPLILAASKWRATVDCTSK